MNIFESLLNVQTELKAPKSKDNSFGKYKYRSAEDILEAVKPILKKYGLTQMISDEVILIQDRYYIKATVTIYNAEGQNIQTTAFAREPEIKKGMDESQITGTASSYARKYALNGMYAIDDTKDADTDEYHNEVNYKPEKTNKPNKNQLINEIGNLAAGRGLTADELQGYIIKAIGKSMSSKDMNLDQLEKVRDELLEIG